MARIHIAASGCVHGSLDFLYSTLAEKEAQRDMKCDLLLCTGDFQAMRDQIDLETMQCPEKYRQMGDFWKYYVGICEAPVLTVVIGGNHEALGYMQEMRLGGWLAPNILYLGEAGVVNIGSLRIAGLSGIYREQDYPRPALQPPFYGKKLKEGYAVKSYSINNLMQVSGSVDLFMTHDWPQHVGYKGDTDALLQRKPFLQRDLGKMGNPFSQQVAERLQPKYWLASHMHVRWDAEIGNIHFRAIDKCLPDRGCLSLLELPGHIDTPQMDANWASVITNSHIDTDLPYPPFGMTDLSIPHSYLHSPHLRSNPQALSLPVSF